MVDIHIHILPDVDDGSHDMEDSILMASLALEGGVNTIIATPHGNMSEGIRRKAEEHEHTSLVREVYSDFCRELKKRGILVRHFDHDRIRGYNRIAIGTREQVDTLIKTVSEIIKEKTGE